MLCLECGKREAKYDGLCEECFLKKVRFVFLPPHINIVVCPHCGSIKIRNRWKDLNMEDALQEIIIKNLRFLHPPDGYTLDINHGEIEGEFDAVVEFNITYQDLKIQEKKMVNFSIKYESCPRCNRYFGNYFEAIIQLRGMRKNEISEVVEYLHERVNYYAKKNKNLFVNREVEKKEGWDFYISDKREAKKIARDFGKKYGAILKESPHLTGRKDGKNLYRITYSVRFPEYRKGDVLRVEDEYYLVNEVDGTFVRALSLSNGKLKLIDSRKHKIEFIVKKEDMEEGMVVYCKENEIQIMDENYRVLEVRTPFHFESGKKIKIFRENNEIYVIPEVSE